MQEFCFLLGFFFKTGVYEMPDVLGSDFEVEDLVLCTWRPVVPVAALEEMPAVNLVCMCYLISWIIIFFQSASELKTKIEDPGEQQGFNVKNEIVYFVILLLCKC